VQHLTIGQAARRAGVTAKALRHYDRIGLLHPAFVDPVTGYRFYHGEQVDQARLIRQLRALDLPLDEIRRLLALAPDRAAFTAALAVHRRRIETRLHRLRGVLHRLDHLLTDPIDSEESLMGDEKGGPADVPHRELGRYLFNQTWRLMDKEDRTPDEDALMIHQAHASLWHWLQDGGPEHNARGEWQVARVYSVLRRGTEALYHARRCVDICERDKIGDWDIAAAYEAMARAYLVSGDREQARQWVEQARQACAEIAEDDERDVILGDVESLGV
jgi:DNA-binding transcriptional MerR regulator